ncbi:hypothetical protein F6455_04890 [Proteobacteria bacterium 005FR1]|nr:hypothetical protein [Proteobacteria bacterium 005FR1]
MNGSKLDCILAHTVAVALLCSSAPVAALDYDFRGHLKYRVQAAEYPRESLYRDLFGERSVDQLLDSRWNLSARQDAFDVQIDYQLQLLDGDTLKIFSDGATPPALLPPVFPEDDRRVFDLTHLISSDDDTVLINRLDRFNLGYSSGNLVMRAGRQVLSWGNGLIFNPVDFFNPFDPAALDTEYKTGDDMFYGQYLLNNGDDLQAVAVGRRNQRDSVSADVSSFALKYHGWLDNWLQGESLLAGAEVDLLLAEHFDEAIAAAGLVKSIGGAVWRGDLMLTDTVDEAVWSAVVNVSYSWVWGGKNVSAVGEYFYNGFGLEGENYTLATLQGEPELLDRLQRGELYTIARHYFGFSATVELTPLWLATPSLLINLQDESALLQLSNRYDIAQNWQLLASLNLPLGSSGTEYGGLAMGLNEVLIGADNLGSEFGLFAQVAFYF